MYKNERGLVPKIVLKDRPDTEYKYYLLVLEPSSSLKTKLSIKNLQLSIEFVNLLGTLPSPNQNLRQIGPGIDELWTNCNYI